MAPDRNPRTYSKKPSGNPYGSNPTGLFGRYQSSSSKATYKTAKTMCWNAPAIAKPTTAAFPTPHRRSTDPMSIGTRAVSTSDLLGKRPRKPTTPKAMTPQDPVSDAPPSNPARASEGKGKAKDKSGATVIDVDLSNVNGSEDALPTKYDRADPSANAISTLRGLFNNITTTLQSINQWQQIVLPVSPIKAAFETIEKTLSSAVCRLETEENDRVKDVVAAINRDESTIKAHNSELAAKDTMWRGLLHTEKSKMEHKHKEASAKHSEAQAQDDSAEVLMAAITANETLTKKLERLQKSSDRKLQEFKADCDAKIVTAAQHGNAQAAAHDIAVRDLEAKHQAEMKEMQREREEFQKLLLENNDRLTEENLRLKNVVDCFKSDNVSDFSADSDSGFIDQDSPVHICKDHASAHPSPTAVPNKLGDDQAASARQPLAPLLSRTVGVKLARSPSPEQWETGPDGTPVLASDVVFFDVVQARDNQLLRFIDSPGVSPTADRTSSGRKRVRAEIEDPESPSKGRAQKRHQRAVVGCRASTVSRRVTRSGGRRKGKE